MMPSAAIFDVDGTICATRSTTSLIWHRRHQHGRWRHRLWLANLIWRAPLVLIADRLSRRFADALVFRQFAGLSEERMRHAAQNCCDTLLVPSLFEGALQEIERHKAAGRRIVLLSGGIDLVLAPLAERLGADLLAQRLDVVNGRFTGRYRSYRNLDGAPGTDSQGSRKGAALRSYAEREGIDLSASYAYGDSRNDTPMLGLVGNPVAVNPDKHLAREARRREWSVCHWSRRADPEPRP